MLTTRFQLLFPPPTSSPPLPAAKTSHVATTPNSGLLFRQKILHLQTLNVDPHKALHQNPDFRSTPLSSLISLHDYLLSLGLSDAAVGRVLDMYPKLLTSDIESDLQPIIDFLLDEVLIPSADIPKSITRCPRLLVTDLTHQLRPTFKFLNQLGFVGSQRINCHTTLLLVSNVERTLKPKIEYLRSVGFSDKEVENMVIRSPGLLTFSVENNLVPKIEYFLNEMKGDLREIKRFPQYFSFSLERKIKPRHRILAEHGIKLPLPKMLRVSDGEFNVRLLEMRLQMGQRKSHFL